VASLEIEWVICPKTGGVTVTKPTTSEVNILGDPDPTTILYQQIQHGALNAASNANFGQWAIQDVYTGCGNFLQYGISVDPSDSSALSLLQYPQPGYSASYCNTYINRCK